MDFLRIRRRTPVKPYLRSILLVCGLIAASGAYAASPVAATASTQDSAAVAAIGATIGQYFQGHATGNADAMRKAFLPSAHIEGIREGKFTSWTVEEYCARFKGNAAADESTRVRTIDSIDVSGNAAMAKATLDHGQTVFTDYFVLLNVDGEWKIANKVYAARKKDDAGK
ncbi:nuclear transport factor 2 family protein [Lysobacter sp. CA199]|uniref:nuclear transport factor 2 family protein n=1 Tax=Lysobacter sp. CA199 TaxID=3455608 RepID=UPI003F8D3DE1